MLTSRNAHPRRSRSRSATPRPSGSRPNASMSTTNGECSSLRLHQPGMFQGQGPAVGADLDGPGAAGSIIAGGMNHRQHLTGDRTGATTEEPRRTQLGGGRPTGPGRTGARSWTGRGGSRRRGGRGEGETAPGVQQAIADLRIGRQHDGDPVPTAVQALERGNDDRRGEGHDDQQRSDEPPIHRTMLFVPAVSGQCSFGGANSALSGTAPRASGVCGILSRGPAANTREAVDDGWFSTIRSQ